jgi:hypothetical protein
MTDESDEAREERERIEAWRKRVNLRKHHKTARAQVRASEKPPKFRTGNVPYVNKNKDRSLPGKARRRGRRAS